MHGGSELTTDHTCGRHETVEECGEQPPEPRRKCATRERSQGEKGRNGRREAKKATQATRCTSYCTYPNSNSNKHDRRSSNSSSTRSNATVPVMLFNEACHRNVDLERPMYYNEANDGRYVPRAILLDFKPGITASVRDHSDSLSHRTTLCLMW